MDRLVTTEDSLKKSIRNVPDFPKPGIQFKDITPLLNDPKAFEEAIDAMVRPFEGTNIDHVVSIESRGFIFGVPIANKLGSGFVPIRKPGKLPYSTYSVSYDLEYGTDTINMHTDAIKEGANVLLVDDLLATGGTMNAAIELVNKRHANILGISFLIELRALQGRDLLSASKTDIHSVVRY